jgi:para-aminobenzoate synthetase component I
LIAPLYITCVTRPFVLPLPWIEPLTALQALGAAFGTMAFIGGGPHKLARWSCIMHAPIQVHQWREGQTGHPFDGLQEALDGFQITPEPELGPFQGGWAGLLSYELGRAFENLPWPDAPTRPHQPDGWPDVWLGLYDTLAIFDALEKRACVVSWGLGHSEVDAETKARSLAKKLSTTGESSAVAAGESLIPSVAREDAEAAIARAIDYIHAGDIFQTNVSIRFSGALAQGDAPLSLFHRLVTRHPSPFATFLSLNGKMVVSHSPERFLSRTAQGQLETRPIKGTAPRNRDPLKDAALAAALEASLKDRAENLMIVDLMRNDLSRVCQPGSVKVPRLCALESFSTVHHLVSDVIGQQKPGLGFFDALAASFPPGSITGAPKVRAMEIISELEREPRGPWCGAMIRVGFDGAADSSVLIRTAACTLEGGRWQISARAGAGIVADSVPETEYDEMLTKVAALRAAARGATGD